MTFFTLPIPAQRSLSGRRCHLQDLPAAHTVYPSKVHKRSLQVARDRRLRPRVTSAALSPSNAVKILIQGRHVQVTESIDAYVVGSGAELPAESYASCCSSIYA